MNEVYLAATCLPVRCPNSLLVPVSNGCDGVITLLLSISALALRPLPFSLASSQAPPHPGQSNPTYAHPLHPLSLCRCAPPPPVPSPRCLTLITLLTLLTRSFLPAWLTVLHMASPFSNQKIRRVFICVCDRVCGTANELGNWGGGGVCEQGTSPVTKVHL